ncbi:MAG: S1 family peptidase [Kutzneria sp.]|nr:S1 family peptidase [Kutzneria sp.]MBV9843937.1 S1 family peptidase [Kutzneria sp.]
MSASPAHFSKYPAISPDLATALRRDLGLDPEKAKTRFAQQVQAAALADSLRGVLGAAFGGSWFDATTGKAVVATTDPARAGQLVAAGAEAKVVRYSEGALDAVQNQVDRLRLPSSVTGWYVDLPTNSVVVEVTDDSAATKAFLASARALSSSVRSVTRPAKPQLMFDLRGGDPWTGSNYRCSLGFSARNNMGRPIVITAGHCTAGAVGAPANGFNEVMIGPISSSHFGDGGDYGTITVANNQWVPRGLVVDGADTVAVKGSTESAVGAAVCRSGSITGWHCGTVQAKDQTVVFSSGTVTGLTKTDVCAEPGDSGGPWMTDDQAQGLTTGGVGGCTNGGMSYFTPINRALNALGLRLVTEG